LALTVHPLPSGLLPHMVYWHQPTPGEVEAVVPNWGREARGEEINQAWDSTGSSTLTQPPIVAKAVWQVYEQAGDLEFLRTMYESLRAHFACLAKERTFAGDNLLYIINPDESGEDNSPRFDISLGVPPMHTANLSLDKRIQLMYQNKACDFVAKDCMSLYFGVADVSFNVIYAEDLVAMSLIAEELNCLRESVMYEDMATAVQCDILTKMKKGDVFLSIDHLQQAHIPVLTWNIFMPLYGGFLSASEATDLVEKYLRNTDYFSSDYGIVTTAKAEASYDPNDGFWRGPIWMAPHWFIYQGLKRYGFDAEASELKAMTIRLLEKSGFREHYHPDTGEGLGAKDFTWGGLVLDMV